MNDGGASSSGRVTDEISGSGGRETTRGADVTSTQEQHANAPERRLCTTCKHLYDAATAFDGDRKTCWKCSKRKALQARKRRRDIEERSRLRSLEKGDNHSKKARSRMLDHRIRLRWIEDIEEE